MRPLLAVVTIVAMSSWLAAPAAPQQDRFDAEQKRLLGQIDTKIAAEAIELAGKLEEYRKTIADFRKDLDEAKKAIAAAKEAAADAGIDAATEVAALRKASSRGEALLRIAGRLEAAPPEFRKFISYDDKIAPLVVAAKRAGALVQNKDLSDLEADEAAVEAKKQAAALRAYTEQTTAMVVSVEKLALDKIRQMSDPAKFVQGFLQDKLGKVFLDKPYDAGSFKFVLTQKVYTKPVFSPDADLAIEVTYKGDTKVKAKGLYFEYNGDRLPLPRFDKVKIDADDALNAALAKGLARLGKELPTLGSPVTVKDVMVEQFSTAGGTIKGGAISATVFIDLAKLADVGLGKLPTISGRVTLKPGGSIDVGALTISNIPIPAPGIALGSTGLFIVGVGGGLDPKSAEKPVTLSMQIATAAGGKSTLYADLSVSFGFPLTQTGLSLDGTLKLNAQQLGTVKAKLTRDKLHIEVTSDLEGLGGFTAEGNLTKEGLDSTGKFSAFFGAANANFNLFIGTNGHGRFGISEKYGIGGAGQADVGLQGSYTPGFKEVKFTGTLSAEVGNEYLGTASAQVNVEGTLLPKPRLKCTGSVGPVRVDFEVETFSEIGKQLEKALLQKRDEVYKYLAERERAASKYAADRERALNNWVYKNAKNLQLDKISTGDKNFDKALGEASQGLKDAGGTISGGAQHAGGVISSGFKGLFGGGSKHSDPPGPSPEEIKQQQEAHEREVVEKQLAGLLAAVPKVYVMRGKNPAKGKGEVANLRMRVFRPVVSPRPGGDAEVSFLVQVSSFHYELDTKKVPAAAARRDEFYTAAVKLSGLRSGSGGVKAEVLLPRLANVTSWDAATLLRDELSNKIEATIKDVRLSGRFEERKLLLHNATKETIAVWCQVETKAGGASWAWKPAGPGTGKSAVRVVVPAGKTVPANLQGRKARLWAESDTGMLWLGHMKHDLVLVREKDADGDSRYYAGEIGSYRFGFTASPAKEHEIAERLVSVRNTTPMTLMVTASARSKGLDGKIEWERTPKPVRVAPGQTVALRDADGLRLRGDDVRFWAEDENKVAWRWVKPWKTPTVRVAAGGYRAAAMGTTLLVLEPTGKGSAVPSQGGDSAKRDFLRSFVPDEAIVPALKGKTLGAARKVLADSGLKASAPEKGGDAVKVLGQKPEKGWLALGGEVRLTLEDDHAQGPQVPSFLGKTARGAEEAATAAGLKIKSLPATSKPTADKARIGKTLVESQDPPAGRRVEKASLVTLHFARYIAAGGGEDVLVPTLKGKTKAEAETAVKALGLLVHIAGEPTTMKTADRKLLGKTLVSSQTPEAGQHLAKGKTVEVRLVHYAAGDGPGKVAVPPLDGKTLADATASAKSAGLELFVRDRVTRNSADKAKVGKSYVEKQSPAAATMVEPHSKVSVTVVNYKQGEAPVLTVTVPNLKGRTVEEARRLVLGLTVQAVGNVSTKTTKDASLVGKTVVDSQTPETGTALAKGKSVEVHLVRYQRAAEPITTAVVPNVIGATLAEAETKLVAAGLKMQKAGEPTSRPTTDNAKGGRVEVASQSPEGGQRLEKSRAVTVRLVRYAYAPPPPAKVPVPSLIGLSLDAAREKAKASGLVVRASTAPVMMQTTDLLLVGSVRVTSQSPTGGELPKGETITVVTVRYTAKPASPPPPTTGGGEVRIASLRGKTLQEAQEEGRRAGYEVRQKLPATVRKVGTRDNSLVGKTAIDTQSIEANRSVKKGTIVEVTLASYFKFASK